MYQLISKLYIDISKSFTETRSFMIINLKTSIYTCHVYVDIEADVVDIMT
jgi:hypothetical protein